MTRGQITLIDQLDDLLKQQRKAIIHAAVTGRIDLSAAPPEAGSNPKS
jgi:type I restriction enzyme S subunit